ncbi:MAG: hypothetical protein ACYC4U_33765, partial [Pirellulaceae bacterium]
TFTVAKASIAQAIGTRLAAARTAAINGNGNGHGKANGERNGNGKSVVATQVRDRSPERDVPVAPRKPR